MSALFRCLCAVSIGLALAAVVQARPRQPDGEVLDEPQALIDHFLVSGSPPLVTYRAMRTLCASTRGGKMWASLEAWTWLDEVGLFHYEMISADGSGLIRRRVLLAALEEERRMHEQRDTQADLTPANYAFHVEEDQDGPLLRIRLTPRRRSPHLIDGTVLATHDSVDLVRVEGRLARRPSFWTRRVDVTRRYTRIAGVRVPLEMSSSADVRLVGTSNFSMTWKYVSVNGQMVAEDAPRETSSMSAEAGCPPPLRAGEVGPADATGNASPSLGNPSEYKPRFPR